MMNPAYKLCVLAIFALPRLAEAADDAPSGKLILSDDFERSELGDAWRITHPTFSIVDGKLQGIQTKESHGAVGQVNVGCQNVRIEFQFQLNGDASVNAVLDDDDYKEGHAGHICRVALRTKGLFLGDDKERLRHEIEEMKKDPARAAEVERLTAGRSKQFPLTLEPGRWYRLRIEVVGDEIRADLDGKRVGELKSSGIAHPVKGTFHFTVSGKDAKFDDLKIWNLDSR